MHAVQFSLQLSYCLLRTVVWTLFCFTRSVFIVSSQCFVSWWQFCPLTGGFQVGDLGCSAAFSSIVVLPAEYARTVGSTLIRFSRKELLYRWSLLRVKSIIWSIFIVFLPVLFFVMAILSVNRRVYVSDGDFDCWFGANQVARSPKSPAWNQKSPIWNITLWLTGIIAITKQSTDREKTNICSIGLQIVLQARMECSVCFISC